MDQSFFDAITPERLVRDLPTYEEEERMRQLEDMWEQPPAGTDR